MIGWRSWVAVGALAAASTADVSASGLAGPSCPASIVPPASTQAPDGWRAWRTSEAREFRLSDVAFSDGPPQERVFLNSNSSSLSHGKRTEFYDFTPLTLRPIWIICQYARTDIALVQQTELKGKRCRLTYAGPKAHQGFAPAITCD
jgi:hypothetical protein